MATTVTCMNPNCGSGVNQEDMVMFHFSNYGKNSYVAGTYCSNYCAFQELLTNANTVFKLDITWSDITPVPDPNQGGQMGNLTGFGADPVALDMGPSVTSTLFEPPVLQDILTKEAYVTSQAVLPPVFKWADTTTDLTADKDLGIKQRRDLYLTKHRLYNKLLGDFMLARVLTEISQSHPTLSDPISDGDIPMMLNLPPTIMATQEAIGFMGLTMAEVEAFESNVNTIGNPNYKKIKDHPTLEVPITGGFGCNVTYNGNQVYFNIVMRGHLVKIIINAETGYELPLINNGIFKVIREQWPDEYDQLFNKAYKHSDQLNTAVAVTDFVDEIKDHVSKMGDEDAVVDAFKKRQAIVVKKFMDIVEANSEALVIL